VPLAHPDRRLSGLICKYFDSLHLQIVHLSVYKTRPPVVFERISVIGFLVQ